MKKKITKLFVAVALMAGISVSASGQAYKQGDKQLNVGLGLGSTLSGSGFTSVVPPIGISFEYGLKEKISVGGYLGYSSASYEAFAWKWNYSYVIIGARGSYHFATSDKLDPYAGLLLGYNAASVSITKPAGYTGPELKSASAGGVVIGGHIGARYYFTEKIGGFAELGYGIAYLTIGLTSKF